jgi:hypothetical protein
METVAPTDKRWADVARPWARASQLAQERSALLDEGAAAAERGAEMRARIEEMSGAMRELMARVDQMDGEGAVASAPDLAPMTEGGGQSWLIDSWGSGYAPPTATEILPVFLLSDEALEWVAGNPDLYVSWTTKSMFKWAIMLSVSRKLSDRAIQTVSGFNNPEQPLPFEATWEPGLTSESVTSNAPQETWVPWVGESRSGIAMPWLGCRCSWPCTQLCWWNCIACGCYQHGAILWSIITLYFEFIILDAMVVQDFIAKVPDRITTWEDYVTLQVGPRQRRAGCHSLACVCCR